MQNIDLSLNSEQTKALETAIRNYRERGFMLLEGTAGTGKSRILIALIYKLIETNEIEEKRICVAVPNHSLVNEWEEIISETGFDSIDIKTTHSLMKMFPEMKDDGSTELRSFEGRNPNETKYLPYDLVIVEEAFMLNKELIQCLYCHGYLSVLLCGDSNQTAPIGEERSFLKEIKGYTYRYTLTKNMRQKDPVLKGIVDEIQKAGNKYKPDYTPKRDFDRKFFELATDYPQETLFMAYTNRSCRIMSDMVRSVQGIENLELADVGEIIKVKNILTAKGRPIVPNNTCVQVVQVIKEQNLIYIKYVNQVFFFQVDLNDEVGRSYIEAKKTNNKKAWTDHQSVCNKYGSFTHPCVSTVHSSQGMTKKYVFLDWSDICKCKSDLTLPYVSASRASEKLYFKK